MKIAPIALFAYNRLEHLRRTVNALAANEMASKSDLHVFSDGPKSEHTAAEVQAVRNWLPEIQGFKSVSVVERRHNLGLAKSIIAGVTQLVNAYDRVIVLEDDMVTSPYFLRYMNEALEMYAATEDVACVHGYIYPLDTILPETFFLKGADCWGWATWQRAWAYFESDGSLLLSELMRRRLCSEFDFDGTARYIEMLRKQIKGQNDSWAVRWYASAFLKGKYTLYPGRSLVQNIGTDGSGRHCGITVVADTALTSTPVFINSQPCIESAAARAAFTRYFRGTAGVRSRLTRLLKYIGEYILREH